jgi:dihydroxyacetone kinase-like predicted kinase
VTLYRGKDLGPGELEALAEVVRSTYSGVEVEAINGGQPLYPVIASVE